MENQLNQKKSRLIIVIIILLIFAIVILGLLLFKKSKKVEIQGNKTEINNNQESKDILQGNADNQPTYTEYVNQAYNYSVKFPDNWYMNNDLSEAKLMEKEIDDEGNKLPVGGQTFWSNYKDINKYNPSNRPADFHILALTVYKDESAKSIEEFSGKLGFDSDSQKDPLAAGDLKGMEFVSAGLDNKNPRVAIIFQKDSLFYVFNLGFIGGDKSVAETMEKIAGSFKFNAD